MRVADPNWEQMSARHARYMAEPVSAALRDIFGKRTIGSRHAERVAFQMKDYPHYQRRRWTRTAAGLKMGYCVYKLLPIEDLRRLHHPVRGKPHLRYYDLLPKGVPAKDLAAINLYLEEVAHAEPCPFDLLVRRGYWANGSWRELAKLSVLYGSF